MKTSKLFLGMLAIAAICSCNKIFGPEGTEEQVGDAYVSVSIVAPGDMATRADDDDFDAGTSDESAVTSALFLFYNGDEFYHLAKPELKWSDVTEAMIVLKEVHPEETKDLSLLVVLNPPADLATTANTLTLPQMKEVVGNYAASAPKSFIMTNSTYTTDGKCEVSCVDNIKTNAKEAIDDPVEIHVERVVAKVSVTDEGCKFKNTEGTEVESVTLDINVDVDTDGDISYNPSTVTVKPVIMGYKVTELAENSYLFKNVTDVSPEWMDEANHRSYWATSPSENTYTLFTYNQIAEETNKVFYCNENTSSDPEYKTNSKLIVAVQFVDESEKPVSFYKYQGEYYDETGILNKALRALKAANDGYVYTVKDLKLEASTKHAWTTVVKFADENGKSAEAINVLNGMSEIMAWTNGYAYYYTNVEHLNDHVGMVRNHSYQVTVNSIKGFGTPVYDPEIEITPEKPTEETYDNLAATINILQWKVVTQEVDFE